MVRRATITYAVTGGGKGFFADWMKEQEPQHHTSSGELLRTKSANDPELAKTLGMGGHAADNVVFSVVMNDLPFPRPKRLIWDGVVRNRKQGIEATKFLLSMQYEVCVVYIEIDPDIAMHRLLTKRNRIDDTPKAIKEKIRLFNIHHPQIDDYFRMKYRDAYYVINNDGTEEQTRSRFQQFYDEETKRVWRKHGDLIHAEPHPDSLALSLDSLATS